MSEFDTLMALAVPVSNARAARDEFEKFADTVEKLRAAAGKTDTSPTEAQREAGNYKKGRLAWKGLTLVIETPKGAVRSGTAGDGTKWSVVMKSSYGYIKGYTSEADGDPIDVFINHDNPNSELIFVVDQVNPDGSWDEHKAMIGWSDIKSAEAGYLENYSDGWAGLGNITPVTLPDFKEWLEHGDSRKPFARATRHDKHAGVRDLEGYENTVLLPERHQFQGLRGEGDYGVPSVATQLQSVYRGHGSVPAGADARTEEKHAGILPNELSVGNAAGTSQKPKYEPAHHVQRANADSSGVGRGDRDQGEHDLLPTQPRVVAKEDTRDNTRLRSMKRPVSKSAFDNYEPHLLLVKRAADEPDHPFTICVDLDGTLAEQERPFNKETIGDPRERAVHWVRLFHEKGARIIIFTVRGDTELVRGWLEENDVPFDYINENPDQPPDSSGKVFADVYWDDRAWNAENPDEHGPEILRRVVAHGGGEESEGVSPGITITRQTVITITGPSLLGFMEDDDGEEGE